MATTQQQKIAQTGAADSTYTLEFRTWNGSAYVWTDYTSRLIDFSGVGATVEEGAFPNAFRMSVGRLELDNTDGMFSDLDVLDGLLYNSSEPYGQSIYKRMLRIKCNGTAIGVALVRDVKPRSDRSSVTIETISLDARASDQTCDGETAERHPLGSTDKTSESTWTTSAPAALTDNVNMYRWRDEEVEGNLSYGWHKDRHYSDVIQATAWALDDLATDITETYRLMTADGREIATTRNIPPDDPAVSTGVATDRCRVVIWNPERNCLVCCVGHKIYDYDITTNTYTLRNTLTAGRDVVRAFYTTEADSGAVATRLVLVQCDINTYGTTSLRVATAWCTTLNASGSGAYTVLDSERSMGTDVFPGTHLVREGENANSIQSVGQILTNASGENIFLQFRQRIDVLNSSAGGEELKHQDDDPNCDAIFEGAEDFTKFTTPPQTRGRGWCAAYKNITPNSNLGFRWAHGGQFACTLNIYTAGGRLYYFTWDSTNFYRLNYINLSTYAAGSVLALGGAATRVPYFAYSPQDATYKKRLYVCQVNWDESGGIGSYSEGQLYYYDLNAAAWTQLTFRSGAGTSDAAWMVMEVCHHTVGSTRPAALLYNRHTLKWRYCSDISGANWAATDAACVATGFTNGAKDQDNRLQGLYLNENYATDKMFFVEAGPNILWSYASALAKENVTPSGATTPDPINADRGLGSYFTSTGANYPDSSTANGVMFWISANDYVDSGTDHPDGRYVLCQYANFDPGFIQLLDVSGLSFWELRTLIAEAFGFVHYYSGDGTLIFKPRTTSGSASFTFSDANRNFIRGEVTTRGFEAVLNYIDVKPYAVILESRKSDIVKGSNETAKDGMLNDFAVSGSPGENAQWRLLFVSATTYDLYKIVAGVAVVKESAQSIASPLQGPTDGAYLSILPEHFTGAFVKDDNFTFWVYEPQESLEVLGDSDLAHWEDPPSIQAYKRNARTFENRFIRRQIAPDYAANIGTWRKARHDIVRIEAAADPAYQPLLRCTLTDANMGYSAVTFQIMGVEHRRNQPSTLTLAKV